MSDNRKPDKQRNRREQLPWSAGQTLALAAVLAALLPLVNMVVAMMMAGFNAANDAAFDQRLFFQQLRQNGHYLTIATLVTNIVAIWMLVKFIRLRSAVGSMTYLAIRWPGQSAWLTTLVGVALFLLVSQLVGNIFVRPKFPDFLLQIYATASPMLLFWIVVGLIAPIAEELCFRGFIYIGLRNSVLGATGAIVVTAAIWSMIHLQYDAYDKSEIFLLGVFLGWLRFRFNSLLPPILAHCLINLTALISLASTSA